MSLSRSTALALAIAGVTLCVGSQVASAQAEGESVEDPPAAAGTEASPADDAQESAETPPASDETASDDEPPAAGTPATDAHDAEAQEFDPVFDQLLDEAAADAKDTHGTGRAQPDTSLFEDGLLGEINFAGSAQLDYLYVPTAEHPRDLSLDGFTTELSLKLAADVTDQISVEVKTCFACHGFELGAAHVDLRPTRAVRIRAGKFVPRFGDFPLRHDPANHLTSDKPLPYDMGRMVRIREWNMSVLPAPYVDNGAEVSVHHGLGESVELDYAAFVLGGLRGSAEATDLDFIQSRTPALYYVDNNSQPAVGGRFATSLFFGRDVAMTLGGSAMFGRYDLAARLDYLIVGGDFVLRLGRFTLRAEYLARRTKMALGDAPEDTFQYGPGADGTYDPYQLKDGFYAEVDFPVYGGLELVGRFDGLRRKGNLLMASPLRSESALLRSTLGLNYVFARRTFRVKLSGEYYDFSDFDDEAAVHLGLVGAF